MFRNSNIIQLLIVFLIANILISGHLPRLLSLLLSDPILALSTIAGIIIGITVHEFSHAFVAYRLGDPTAKLQGRLTLNPASHLDPVGTLMIIFLGIGFGKPTPFDPYNLRNIKRDSALISVAGAVSNFILAILLSVPYLLAYYTHSLNPTIIQLYYYLSALIFINVGLGVFNLLPVSPLDGFKVVAGLLPRDWYEDFMQMERYGIFILMLLLIFPGLLSSIVFPPIAKIIELLLPGFSTPI
ncbi:MAG TPA: site-2 protease family protein [Candidatus Saccharimonadales bacterium]|nr:site-2 protease family protein [Candidatus Saccharimonadales bacterium]